MRLLITRPRAQQPLGFPEDDRSAVVSGGSFDRILELLAFAWLLCSTAGLWPVSPLPPEYAIVESLNRGRIPRSTATIHAT